MLPNISLTSSYYSEMSEASDTWFLDVLLKNEAKHSDMVDIMTTMQKYLGDSTTRVLSGGDQLTCERQSCAQRHLMDGDSVEERLQLLEPVCEDWHAMMCFMKLRILLAILVHIIMNQPSFHRYCGGGY